MRRIILLSVMATYLVWQAAIPVDAASDVSGSPTIINLYLDWQIRDEDLATLARWDVVVLDANQQARYPDKILRLRQMNPKIKILAYLPTEEYAVAHYSEPANYPFARLGAAIRSDWWVAGPSGERVYFWPGQPMLNVTDQGQSGEKWNEYFPRFIRDEIMASGMWDGIFLDNVFDGISHFAKSSYDLDRNGKADDKATADKAWNAGMKKMLRLIRQYSPNAILLGNGGAAYADQLHGVMFEHFPSWSWGPNFQEVRDTLSKNMTPAYTAINVNTDNRPDQKDYRLMRFGLGSALTAGSLYSFDQGDYNHHVVWWYDEYEVPLGRAKGGPRILSAATGKGSVPAVWMRSYDNGLVLVNSTTKAQKVALPGVYEKLRGSQDKKTNDGAVVNSVTLAAQDGLLLIKRLETSDIVGTSFLNGAFIRAYDMGGQQTQNGFFAQRGDEQGGATLHIADLDRDGLDDVVSALKGTITVSFGGTRKPVVFRPFGSAYSGTLYLAVGNANRDTALEIVIGREGKPPETRIFAWNGKELVRWSAYMPLFGGGVRVAMGDLDGDGMREVITAAGPGGGPHIRIWKTDGKPWGGSFFAFNPNDAGGASVASGDVDGDGKDEVVVGSGRGAKPRVRIFDARGNLKREIDLGEQQTANGIDVGAADLNGDGIDEILVGGMSAI
ncbi:MAG: putative glycoside hydrolase [Patescibacteria group bacterium]|nr:putative glycoside hydrolase [Patescibacteria group bacterium]